MSGAQLARGTEGGGEGREGKGAGPEVLLVQRARRKGISLLGDKCSLLLPNPFGGRGYGLVPKFHALLSPLEIEPAQVKTTFPSCP